MSTQADRFLTWLDRQPRGCGKVRVGGQTYACSRSMTVPAHLPVAPRLGGREHLTLLDLVELLESLAQPQRAPFAWLDKLVDNR